MEPFRVVQLLERAKALEREGRDVVHFEVGEPDLSLLHLFPNFEEKALTRARLIFDYPAKSPPEHVGFAWALHVAWNLTMFAGDWRRGVGGPFLSEPEIFDSFVGHPTVVGIAGAAALGSLLLIIDRRAG